jgi:hypothetical protein
LTMDEPKKEKILRRCPRVMRCGGEGEMRFQSVNGGDS